jgi:hypothetical protein
MADVFLLQASAILHLEILVLHEVRSYVLSRLCVQLYSCIPLQALDCKQSLRCVSTQCMTLYRSTVVCSL